MNVDNYKNDINYNLSPYILKILKYVSGVNFTLDDKANNFILSILYNQIFELLKLYQTNNSLFKSINRFLKGKLFNHAICEGNKAIIRYLNNSTNNLNRSLKAGITFPVLIIQKLIKLYSYDSIYKYSDIFLIYLTVIIEYITAEILDLSTNVCINNSRNKITVEDIKIAISNDEELNFLFNKLPILITCDNKIKIKKNGLLEFYNITGKQKLLFNTTILKITNEPLHIDNIEQNEIEYNDILTYDPSTS